MARPITDTGQRRPNTERTHYQIAQHDKSFDPQLLVIPAGSIVEFPNHDPFLSQCIFAFEKQTVRSRPLRNWRAESSEI
jgi:hypothetical protein